MCLSSIKGPFKAKKDFVVYKHIINDGRGYFTSFRRAKIEIGKTYESELTVDFRVDWSLENSKYSVVETGLHSYVNFEDANEQAVHFKEVLVKCIVPKGSIYYTGKFASRPSIASDTLTYVKELKKVRKRPLIVQF